MKRIQTKHIDERKLLTAVAFCVYGRPWYTVMAERVAEEHGVEDVPIKVLYAKAKKALALGYIDYGTSLNVPFITEEGWARLAELGADVPYLRAECAKQERDYFERQATARKARRKRAEELRSKQELDAEEAMFLYSYTVLDGMAKSMHDLLLYGDQE